ncbi:MAG: DoxX family membrane protein [Bacteroidota bacterium]
MGGNKYSNLQLFWLVTLRVIIGWHFLYEGLIKLSNPNWSSYGYLMDSKGFLEGFYQMLAANPERIEVINFLNIWGLIIIGFSLMLGLLTRPSIIAGIILLISYYLSHPPFIGLTYSLPMEGSYLIVNKTLIEMTAMAVLYVFPTSKVIGIDRLVFTVK